jgi:tetratricopeptide (TPR) repeat protein
VVGQQEGSASSVEFEVLDLLSHLVDKSLVVVDSEGVNVRYRLLETVREYGSAKLAEAGEPDWVRRRHRDFFLALASTHEDPVEPTRKWSSGEWIRQVHADEDSFRTALEWSIAQGDDEAAVQLAAALWRYWWWTRPLEGSDWLERVLAGPASTLGPERLEALIGSGFLLPRSGRTTVQRGEEVLRHALGLAEETGMAKEAARARYFLGELAISRGRPEEAEPLLTAALQAFEAMDAPLSAGWCHHALGWMAMAADDQRQAQEHFEQVFKLAQGGGAAELLRIHGMAALALLAALAGEGVGRADPRDGGPDARGRGSAPSCRQALRGLPGARGGAGRGGPGKGPLRRGERLPTPSRRGSGRSGARRGGASRSEHGDGRGAHLRAGGAGRHCSSRAPLARLYVVARPDKCSRNQSRAAPLAASKPLT